jgi:hypothetical protein
MMIPSTEPGKSSPASINYAASGGYLALAIDPSILEEYLRSSESHQKALRDSAGLSDAAARAGGFNTGWFGFENQSESVRVVVEALRKAAEADTNASPRAMPLPFGKEVKEWLDFSLLPPFDKIARYFSISTYTISENVDGISFKMFAPTPPQLKK